MSKTLVDPSNLKSFQRISVEDLRYLKELGEAAAASRALSDRKMVGTGVINFALILQPKRLFQLLKESLDKLLYETVPVNEVYASRE